MATITARPDEKLFVQLSDIYNDVSSGRNRRCTYACSPEATGFAQACQPSLTYVSRSTSCQEREWRRAALPLAMQTFTPYPVTHAEWRLRTKP